MEGADESTELWRHPHQCDASVYRYGCCSIRIYEPECGGKTASDCDNGSTYEATSATSQAVVKTSGDAIKCGQKSWR